MVSPESSVIGRVCTAPAETRPVPLVRACSTGVPIALFEGLGGETEPVGASPAIDSAAVDRSSSEDEKYSVSVQIGQVSSGECWHVILSGSMLADVSLSKNHGLKYRLGQREN